MSELNIPLSQKIMPGLDVPSEDAAAPAAFDTDGGDDSSGQGSQTPPKKPPEQEHQDLLDGTLSALGDVHDDNAPHTSYFHEPNALERWFAWKESIEKDHGLTFGGSWGVLWQNYTNALNAQPNAIGSKVTINVSYVLLNRRKVNALSFDLAVEDRRPLGTKLPPLQGGLGAGSAVPTAATWGQFTIGITQAYIRQDLAAKRFQYSVGKIFAPNYIDAYPFFDDNRQFLNLTFSTSPSIPTPLRGFGLVAAWFPAKGGLYLKSGMFTNLSSDTGSTITDFFTKNQHFYMFEGGMSSLARTGTPIQARGPMDANNIHLTGWYKNPTPSTNSPRSYGTAFNANRMAGSQLMWFLRSGWSVGNSANWALSGGLGWRPPKATSNLFGAGFGWVRPTNSGARSQYTAETFFRFHIAENIAVTPDIQLLLHPSANPNVNTMWVFSFRARIAF